MTSAAAKSAHVKVEQFEGPFSVLVQLIDDKKLSINDISLAEITEQYFSYLSDVEEQFPEQLADFLVVASRLLLIKSRTLLPTLEEEEDDEGDLEEQLKLYQAFVKASADIEKRLLEGPTLRARPLIPMKDLKPVFAPDAITKDMLRETMKDVLQHLEPVVTLPQTLIERAIRLEDQIEHIRTRVKKHAELKFSHLLKSSKTRTDVVVNFLAVLELVKQRHVRVSQKQAFHDIVIKRV